MQEHFRNFVDCLPFVNLITQAHPTTPLMTRLIETAIMSAVAAGFATYIGLKMLEQDVSTLHDSMKQIDAKVEKIDSKVESIRHDLYVPRGEK